MKILSNKTENWNQHQECSNCNSALMISIEDIVGQRTKIRGYLQKENELTLFYTCAACKRKNHIHWRDIPVFIWWKVSDTTPEYGPPKNLWQRFRRWIGLDWEPK